MLILPSTTPVAVQDQNNVNQAQQNQTQSLELSRKASDTVQLSAQAQALAGAEIKNSPSQKAELQAAEQIVKAVEISNQQAVNPVTQQPESNKIDVVV